jgi:threonine dehydrogenase-like Zn-dependent dehydrogenase
MESDQAILIPEFTRALRAVLQNPPAPGDRVMVVGGGSLGLLVMEALRQLGHQRDVWLAVEHPFEVEMARNLGYRDIVMFHGAGAAYEEVAEALEARVHFPEVGRITLEGGADLIYETTGLRHCIEDALNFAAEGKKLVLVGMSEPKGLDLGPVWFKDVSISATTFSGSETFNGEITTTFDVAMELAAQHELPSGELVTHEFALEDYRNAVTVLADRGTHKAIKVIFRHVV